MLFFFGIRRSIIATEHLSGLACAYCHTPETLTCTVFSRYVHLFWVPAFPVGKFSLTSCQHCKQVLTAREMPASYRAPVQAVQQQAKTPLTHFALLLLFGAVVLLGLLISVFGKKEPTAAAATAAIAAPVPEAVGTRYKFDVADEGRQYGLIEVTGVTADSVQYLPYDQRAAGPLNHGQCDSGPARLRDPGQCPPAGFAGAVDLFFPGAGPVQAARLSCAGWPGFRRAPARAA